MSWARLHRACGVCRHDLIMDSVPLCRKPTFSGQRGVGQVAQQLAAYRCPCGCHCGEHWPRRRWVWEATAVLDDGTAQARLHVEDGTALALLGVSERRRVHLESMAAIAGGELVYRSNAPPALLDKRRVDDPTVPPVSPEEAFGRVVATSSILRPVIALAKRFTTGQDRQNTLNQQSQHRTGGAHPKHRGAGDERGGRGPSAPGAHGTTPTGGAVGRKTKIKVNGQAVDTWCRPVLRLRALHIQELPPRAHLHLMLSRFATSVPAAGAATNAAPSVATVAATAAASATVAASVASCDSG